MPIRVKQETIKFKPKGSQDFVNVDVIGGETADKIVQDITNAKNTALTEINNSLNTAISQIPNENLNVWAQTNILQNNLITEFVQGSWGWNTPSTPSDSDVHYKRIRSKTLIPVKKNMVIEYQLPDLKPIFGILKNYVRQDINDDAWLNNDDIPLMKNEIINSKRKSYTIPYDGYLAIILTIDDNQELSVPSYFSAQFNGTETLFTRYIRIMTEEIATLKFLNRIKSDKYIFQSRDMAQGYWSYARKINLSTRIRNRELIYVSQGSQIYYNNPNREIYIGVLKDIDTHSNDSYYQTTGWLNAGGNNIINIQYSGYLVILERLPNEETLAEPILPSTFDSTIILYSFDYLRLQKIGLVRKTEKSKKNIITDGLSIPIKSFNLTLYNRYNREARTINLIEGTPFYPLERFILYVSNKNLVLRDILSRDNLWAKITWTNNKTTLSCTNVRFYCAGPYGTAPQYFYANTTYTLSCHFKIITKDTVNNYAPRLCIRQPNSNIYSGSQAIMLNDNEQDVVTTWTPSTDCWGEISIIITGATPASAEVQVSNVQVETGNQTEFQPNQYIAITEQLPESFYQGNFICNKYGDCKLIKTHEFSSIRLGSNPSPYLTGNNQELVNFWVILGNKPTGPQNVCYGVNDFNLSVWCNKLQYKGTTTSGIDTEPGYRRPTDNGYYRSIQIIIPKSDIQAAQGPNVVINGVPTTSQLENYVNSNHGIQFIVPLREQYYQIYDYGQISTMPTLYDGKNMVWLFNIDGEIQLEYYANINIAINQLQTLIINNS